MQRRSRRRGQKSRASREKEQPGTVRIASKSTRTINETADNSTIDPPKEVQIAQAMLPLLSNWISSSSNRRIEDSLTENSSYTVIGVCGAEGLGKTTLIRALSDPYGSYDLPIGCLAGLTITPERLFLVDTKPLFSITRMVQSIKPLQALPKMLSLKSAADCVEVHSLATFLTLMEICHTVVVLWDGESTDVLKMLRNAGYLSKKFETCNHLIVVSSKNLSKCRDHMSYVLADTSLPVKTMSDDLNLLYLPHGASSMALKDVSRTILGNACTAQPRSCNEKQWHGSLADITEKVMNSDALKQFTALMDK